MYKIYGLVDPRKPDIIRYVGQSKTPRRRLMAHISTAKKNKKRNNRLTPKESWILYLIKKHGIKPEMVFIEENIQELSISDEKEIYWIAHYRSIGQADLNFADGGKAKSSENFRREASERNKRLGLLTVEERKQMYLSLPTDAKRPSRKENFANFLNENSEQYDAEFTKKIKERFPHWFIEHEKKLIKEKKEELLLLPFGAKRPRTNTKLGTALATYTYTGANCFDEEFDKKIREKQPHWFIKDKAEVNINIILSIPIGDPRPEESYLRQALTNYTSKNAKTYRPDFDKIIKERQPTWFRETKAKKYIECLLNVPIGEKIPKELINVLRNYTQKNNRCYRPEFDKIIREKQPTWFRKI